MEPSQSEFADVLPTAAPRDVGLSSPGLARLTEVMQREIDARRLPGVSMMIARGGKVGYRATLGMLKPGGPAMRDDAIFRIYSMTKPIVSVAVMMLVEEGRLLISDPLAQYLAEFAGPKVGVERDGKLELVAAEQPISIQDLLRHTSGLAYPFTGDSPVHRLYAEASLWGAGATTASFVEALARLPLISQPGSSWDYSVSTDVLGRLIEVVSGRSLGAFLEARVFAPLGMKDTGFFAPSAKHERLAETFAEDPDTGAPVSFSDPRVAPSFQSGGGGLVSTIEDYARFARMLSLGGSLGDVRLLSRKSVEHMTADHLGPDVQIGSKDILPPGYGFGLGFAVRRETGLAPMPGTPGEYFWGGLAGTVFVVAPKEDMIALMMIQAPGRPLYYQQLFPMLANAALL